MKFPYGLSDFATLGDFATLTGEQLRERTPEELAALPPVAAKLQEAADQARRYGAALRERYGLTDLRLFAVAGLGVERVVWRAVTWHPPAPEGVLSYRGSR